MRQYLKIRHAYVPCYNNGHTFFLADDEPDFRRYPWFGLRLGARI